jgi:hypothetical protein
MPFNCKFISLYNNQVGIVMEKNYTIAWTIEGDVYPIADDPTQSPTHETILFHPTLRDTFVIISRDIAHNRSWIVVDEFTSGICTNTCEFSLYLEDNNEEFVEFDIRPIDENGLYSICWVDGHILDGNYACVEYYEKGAFFHHLLSYNVYEKAFMMKCFYGGISNVDKKFGNLKETDLRPLPDEFGSYCFVWGDQMLTPYVDFESNSLFVQTVWSFEKMSKSPVPYISENGTGVMTEKDDHGANGFRFFPICMLWDNEGGDDGWGDDEGGYAGIQLYGDDKCITLFAEGSIFELGI